LSPPSSIKKTQLIYTATSIHSADGMKCVLQIALKYCGVLCLAAVGGLIASSVSTMSAEEKASALSNLHMSIWQAVAALQQQMPLDRKKVEYFFSIQLQEYEEPSNDAFHFFKAEALPLGDVASIAKLTLMIKRSNPYVSMVGFDLAGSCIGLEQFENHYPNLTITEVPRGRSLDEATSHSAYFPWGRIAFGFKERKPECLASIAFHPNAAQ
jgi:hypothetical protein